MKEVTLSEFKARCFALICEVEKTGKPLRITRRDKPLAEVVPVSSAPKRKLGRMAGTVEILGDIISPIVLDCDSFRGR